MSVIAEDVFTAEIAEHAEIYCGYLFLCALGVLYGE
jgi:hypothetical protein